VIVSCKVHTRIEHSEIKGNLLGLLRACVGDTVVYCSRIRVNAVQLTHDVQTEHCNS
jgi:hypothetical protein